MWHFYFFSAEASYPIWSMSLPRWNPCFPLVLYFFPRFTASLTGPSPEPSRG